MQDRTQMVKRELNYLKAYYNVGDKLNCMMLVGICILVNLDAIRLIYEVYRGTFELFGYSFWSFIWSLVLCVWSLVEYDEFREVLKGK